MTLYIDNVYSDWEQLFLLSGDRHHDSIHCDRDLELKHLELAKEKDAYIIDVGDVFDVMQGRYDPRRTYKGLRPEYKVDNYLDEIVKDAAEFYGPYADRFLMMGRGNHDSSVLKNNGVDVLGNLVHRLNSDHGGHIQAGGFGGWVRIMCRIGGTQQESVLIKYYHGAGGGGPVTRGVIQSNRQAVYEPDADIILNGHTHDAWYVPIERERVSEAGNVFSDIQHHIRVPSYSNDYGDGAGGWFVETWKAPRPRGAVWMRLTCQKRHTDRRSICIEPIMAIE
jgi:predicted phosphodiesterase